MDTDLILVFLCIFVIFGTGGTLFYQLRKDKVRSTSAPASADAIVLPSDEPNADATYSPWKQSVCKTLSGTCGKGEIVMTRTCVREGSGVGKRCNDEPLHKSQDCYVQCTRPTVVDWGHPNDANGIPIGSPLKGWYDISGQGQPNDYCRWVGPPRDKFFACHVEKDPYVKVDPSHISFSGGPANQMVPFHPTLIKSMCPTKNEHFLLARDPDLRKSIANGMFSHCGAWCVYDYRNPKTGWMFDGAKWNRVEDMPSHQCGTIHQNEMISAVRRYEDKYAVQNAWFI